MGTPCCGDWLSGTFLYYSGSAFTPTAGSDLNNDAVAGTDRPTVNGQHLGRNSERFPDVWSSALRLSKKFGIGPVQLAAFAECFNCTNHINKSISGNNQIYGSGLTPDQNPRSTFRVVDSLFATSGIFGPRTIQLGLRFDF